MDTAARYTEAKIKTYGFETKLDLCICEFRLELERFRPMKNNEIDFDRNLIPFELIFMGPSDEGHIHVSVLVPNRQRNGIKKLLGEINPQFTENDIQITAPVELLYFYGPHFGDRFGIADFTYNALSESNIPLVASAFSSSSILLVFPEHCALKAKAVFLNLFEIPKTVQRPSFISIDRRN